MGAAELESLRAIKTKQRRLRMASRGLLRLLISAGVAALVVRVLPLLHTSLPERLSRWIWALSADPAYTWMGPASTWAEAVVVLLQTALPAYVIGLSSCLLLVLWRRW
jgi:hypothetical protein